jgi:hypothetical protein
MSTSDPVDVDTAEPLVAKLHAKGGEGKRQREITLELVGASAEVVQVLKQAMNNLVINMTDTHY